mgnify:FL=1
MKRVIAIIMTVFMMIGLAACGAADNTEQQKEITDIAVYDDTQADILTADFYDLEDGTPVVRVHFKFTNNQADGLYMYECFAVRAFQNDTQLDDITNINEDSETGDSAELIREVKNGASLEGSYVFKLADDSDVELRVCTPTADEDLLAQKIFSKQE